MNIYLQCYFLCGDAEHGWFISLYKSPDIIYSGGVEMKHSVLCRILQSLFLERWKVDILNTNKYKCYNMLQYVCVCVYII